MKFFVLLTVLITASVALSACRTTADTRRDVYSVDLDGDRYDGGKCPPGHRMKGWC